MPSASHDSRAMACRSMRPTTPWPPAWRAGAPARCFVNGLLEIFAGQAEIRRTPPALRVIRAKAAARRHAEYPLERAGQVILVGENSTDRDFSDRFAGTQTAAGLVQPLQETVCWGWQSMRQPQRPRTVRAAEALSRRHLRKS